MVTFEIDFNKVNLLQIEKKQKTKTRQKPGFTSK